MSRAVRERLGTSQAVPVSSFLKSYISFVVIERVFYFFGAYLNWSPMAIQFIWVIVLGYWVWGWVLSRMIFGTLQVATALALLSTVPATAQTIPNNPATQQKASTQESADVNKLHHAAEQGDAKAQYNLGVIYSSGQGVPQDYAQAVAWYRKAAEQGLAPAQFNLGLLYLDGKGVRQDYTQAVVWFSKAAEQGVASAQFNLGFSYVHRHGVRQDYAQGVAWYRKAAEQGNTDAEFNLGLLYLDGKGVPQDSAQAVAWFRKGAEQGNVDAQYNLGSLYDSGQGVRQDYAQAAVWYRKAAEQGNANAQYNLGALYGNGQGVPQDFVETHKWFTLASARSSGDDDRKRFLDARDAVARMMTSAQLAEAQKRARAWQDAFAKKSK